MAGENTSQRAIVSWNVKKIAASAYPSDYLIWRVLEK